MFILFPGDYFVYEVGSQFLNPLLFTQVFQCFKKFLAHKIISGRFVLMLLLTFSKKNFSFNSGKGPIWLPFPSDIHGIFASILYKKKFLL
jgi:hypothetical protein